MKWKRSRKTSTASHTSNRGFFSPLAAGIAGFIVVLSASVFASSTAHTPAAMTKATPAKASYDTAATPIAIGANVYVERCVLCHGSKAMGEGLLPLMIKDYASDGHGRGWHSSSDPARWH